MVVSFLVVLLITSISVVSAFSVSSWFKALFTGNAVEGDNQGESQIVAETTLPETTTASENTIECGEYELETPKDAIASSQFSNYRAANAIDGDVNTHWFGDPALKYPKTLDLDMGGKRCVDGIELNVFIWDVPLKLEIQASDDGREWKTVSEQVVLKEGAKFERVEFPEIVTRHLRIHELAGKRPYGALSEIRVHAARQATGGREEAKPIVENVVGGPAPDKFYEIGGKRVFLEIDGASVEEFLSKAGLG